MTREQIDDLYEELSLYSQNQKRDLFNEYVANCNGRYSQDEWHDFLFKKLNRGFYWEAVGLL